MNSDWRIPRKRRQNLFVVEGKHEKNALFDILFKCFPEMNINMDDVIIYGTNIYNLYKAIVKEYGEEWIEQDIDLPFVVGKKEGNLGKLNKNDFINIVLVFDYEHHDTSFSEDKILNMQNYFNDETDAGKLFINYPMIESYQHFEDFPDNHYAKRSIPVTLNPGKKYKQLVKETRIAELINLKETIEEKLSNRYGIVKNNLCKTYTEKILRISNIENFQQEITEILKASLDEKTLNTAKHQLQMLVREVEYLTLGIDYYDYMRSIFQQIIICNIKKANKIQNGLYEIDETVLKECFYELDLKRILEIQNSLSRDKDIGIIQVLNTCVFIVPDYRFELIETKNDNGALNDG